MWQGETEQKMLSADFLPPRQTGDHIRLHWEEQSEARLQKDLYTYSGCNGKCCPSRKEGRILAIAAQVLFCFVLNQAWAGEVA